MKLPKQKVPASESEARVMVIYSKPKVGKTTVLSHLENNLIIDTEHGSDYIEALKVSVDTFKDFVELIDEIKKENKPYKYLTLDTLTTFEDMCIKFAEMKYMKTSMGKNWLLYDKDGNMDPTCQKALIGNILNLPMGQGYRYLREAVSDCIDMLKKNCQRVILTCHLKDSVIDDKGLQFTTKDVDLTGKVKSIVTSRCDAIGYLHRKGNQNIITFNPNGDILDGSRPKHLCNKDIVISEYDDEGNYHCYWSRIYTDEKDN